jgi:undecaprenyl-diphosphatase
VTPVLPPAALGRRLLRTAVILVILAVLAWPVRTVVHRVIAEGFADSPLAGPAGFIADKGLLVIVAVAAVTAVWTFRRDRAALLRLLCGGVGVVLAYLTSELVKMVVTENRPCAGGDVTTVLACPTGGDWSWPSNHSVIAAAIATVCILALPWQRWFVATVCTLAGVEAFSRVAAGVHYAHDALSGLALGLVVVTLTVIVLVPRVAPVVDRMTRRRQTSPQYYE